MMSQAARQKTAEMTIRKLESTGSEENFLLYGKRSPTWLVILMLVMQFCHGSRRDLEGMKKSTVHAQEEQFPGSLEDIYWPIYFEASNLAINGIQKCFDQPGYEVYSKLESFLVKATNSEGNEEELKFVVDFYKEDFNPKQLKLQLSILSCNLPPISSAHNLALIS